METILIIDDDTKLTNLLSEFLSSYKYNIVTKHTPEAGLEYFRENAQSADLVTFGGKYVGAPHSSGFVCGKADLIEAITHQSFVAYHYDGSKAVGRAMKIDRHDIVGLVAGVEDWFTMNHEERILGYESRFQTFENILNNIPVVTFLKCL